NFTKYTVAPAGSIFTAVVEEAVIFYVDKKLGCSAVWIIGARHSQGASQVLQAIVGFVLNGGASFFLLEIFSKATALNHKTINHTVKNSAVVKTFFYILFEIGSGFRRFIKIQFD